jgi:hypothetical protein
MVQALEFWTGQKPALLKTAFRPLSEVYRQLKSQGSARVKMSLEPSDLIDQSGGFCAHGGTSILWSITRRYCPTPNPPPRLRLAPGGNRGSETAYRSVEVEVTSLFSVAGPIAGPKWL